MPAHCWCRTNQLAAGRISLEKVSSNLLVDMQCLRDSARCLLPKEEQRPSNQVVRAASEPLCYRFLSFLPFHGVLYRRPLLR